VQEALALEVSLLKSISDTLTIPVERFCIGHGQKMRYEQAIGELPDRHGGPRTFAADALQNRGALTRTISVHVQVLEFRGSRAVAGYAWDDAFAERLGLRFGGCVHA